MCTKQLTTDGHYSQPFVPMLEVLAAEALQRLQAPDQQAASRRLGSFQIAEILSAFSHFRYHPGDVFLQAALTTLRIQLQDTRQQVRSRPATSGQHWGCTARPYVKGDPVHTLPRRTT